MRVNREGAVAIGMVAATAFLLALGIFRFDPVFLACAVATGSSVALLLTPTKATRSSACSKATR